MTPEAQKARATIEEIQKHFNRKISISWFGKDARDALSLALKLFDEVEELKNIEYNLTKKIENIEMRLKQAQDIAIALKKRASAEEIRYEILKVVSNDMVGCEVKDIWVRHFAKISAQAIAGHIKGGLEC